MTLLNDLAAWLTAPATESADMADLFLGFANRLAARGLPVWRMSMAIELLHPEDSGPFFIWLEGSLQQVDTGRKDDLVTKGYLNSPVQTVNETGQPFRRRIGSEPEGMPLVEELRQAGATDYYMLPLPFLDKTRTAAISYATRAAGGFDDATLRDMDVAARLLSPFVEREVLRRIAVDLLTAYVGRIAGERVFEGQIERGDVQTVAAAIWVCDLRDFTRMTDALPLQDTIDLLNGWFESTGGAVEAAGGEILKFMGDGLLAVFPIADNAATTCDAAYDAALQAAAALDALNAERRKVGGEALRFGLALHRGVVAFGNIGTRRRLDFTAIGPAVNHASRLEELTKQVGRPILASAAFAETTTRPLVGLGGHTLRGAAWPVDVFALPCVP